MIVSQHEGTAAAFDKDVPDVLRVGIGHADTVPADAFCADAAPPAVKHEEKGAFCRLPEHTPQRKTAKIPVIRKSAGEEVPEHGFLQYILPAFPGFLPYDRSRDNPARSGCLCHMT